MSRKLNNSLRAVLNRVDYNSEDVDEVMIDEEGFYAEQI
jgi:hypothetical protein